MISKMISFAFTAFFFTILGSYLTITEVNKHSGFYCKVVQSKNIMDWFKPDEEKK